MSRFEGLDLTDVADGALLRRFKAKVDPALASGCRPWGSSRDPKGYGRFSVAGRMRGAHVVSFALFHGPVPPGMQVCHFCDFPPCVEPSDLFLGTNIDNHVDSWIKGRRAGTTLTLTPQDVARIRALMPLARGEQARLARELGVHRSCINDLVRGKTWRHAIPS